MAKKNKKTIKIAFLDGKVDMIPGKLWDDYEINWGLFIVKKKGEWIAAYNMNIIAYFVVY